MDEKIEVAELTWKTFFDNHAKRYDENAFTHSTKAEVDFFIDLFPLGKGSKILDVGCGTGRHSVELAQRGFQVTGLDFSPGMLAVAREKASRHGVSVDLIEADATEFSLSGFDAAICVCEGAVGLLGQTDDPLTHDLSIFKNIFAALRPGGGFLLTSLNGYRAIRNFRNEDIADGIIDPATMVAEYYDDWNLPEGVRAVKIRERLFIPPETVSMLNQAGFRVDHVFGGTAGQWARRPLDLDEVEALYVCRKV